MARPKGSGSPRRRLKPVEAEVIAQRVAGKTLQQAGEATGAKRSNARQQAHEIAKRPHVREAFSKALNKAGATLNEAARQVARGLKTARLGSHDQYVKLAMQGHGLKTGDEPGGVVLNIGVFIARGREERGLPPL